MGQGKVGIPHPPIAQGASADGQPFEPDFVQTYCSLLVVLAEAYQHILSVTTSPIDCTQNLLVTFQKVDEKIRKNILGCVVKEIDDFCRAEAQSELDGLEKFISIASPS